MEERNKIITFNGINVEYNHETSITITNGNNFTISRL